jgi:hypothetical protein
MSNSSSDAVIDVRQVCCHMIQLRLGIHLRAPAEPPDALPARYVRIQAASPPPTRAGGPWEDGILVDDGMETRPLLPTDADDPWKRRGVDWVTGIASLDQPKPSTIVLDRWLVLPARRAQLAVLPERAEARAAPAPASFTALNEVDPRGFLSVPYPLPRVDGRPVPEISVDYSGEYTLPWTRQLMPDGWVAISLDRFCPPERDSADYIAQVEDCTRLPLRSPHEPPRKGDQAGG